jgi:transposase
MSDVRIIGLDIAKSVFQLHGVDDAGATVLQKRLTRARLLPFFEKLPPCLVGIEACATSHFWAASSRGSVTRSSSCRPST